jgi:hypothetical protein
MPIFWSEIDESCPARKINATQGRGGTPNSERLYNYLLAPGILLVFYPAVYGIQRDQDTRMVETLFGIPDYHYIVWLTRLATLWAETTFYNRLYLILGSVVTTLFALLRLQNREKFI